MASQVEKDRAYTRHRLPKEWELDKSKLAFTVDALLSPEECARLVDVSNQRGYEPALLSGHEGMALFDALRAMLKTGRAAPATRRSLRRCGAR